MNPRTWSSLAVAATVIAISTPARADGQIAWRIQIDDPIAHEFTQGLAADGTVYVPAANDLLAVSPDGQILWTAPARASEGPVVVGADGTIYVAGDDLGTSIITAVNPDGTIRWTFTTGDTQGIIAGPGIGPDGNIYAAVDTVPGGIGMFSLDPQGDLRWSNEGSPAVHQNGGGGRAIAFGADRLFVAFKAGQGTTPVALWSFRLDNGNQLFYRGTGCDSVPTMNVNGELIVARGACGVTSLDPDGSENWFAPTPPGVPTDTFTIPVTGPDGTIYIAHSLWRFWALNPDGTTKWYINDADEHGFMNRLGVSPTNSLVLDLGAPDAGVPGWIKAYSTSDGSPRWAINLPVDPQGNVIARSSPTFTPDGSRAYFAAQVLGGNGYSFFYAIDLEPAPVTPGDLNEDGVVDVVDLLALLAQWGACPGCAADLDGDGMVGIVDLLMLLGNWT